MEVPASATATPAAAHGAENVSAGASSGLFGSLARAARGKKGQLPPFAAILAEQSDGKGSEANVLRGEAGALMGTPEDQGAGALPETASAEIAHANFAALLSPQLQNVKGDNAQSSPAAPAKSEIKTAARHKASGAGFSSAPEKKQTPGAADASSASALAFSMPQIAHQIAAPVMLPVSSEGRPHAFSTASTPAFTPPASPASQFHPSEMPGAQEAPPVPASLPVVMTEAAVPAAARPLATGSAKHDAGREQTPLPPPQPADSPAAEVSTASLPPSRNALQERQGSPALDLSFAQNLPSGVSREALSPAGVAMEQAAAAAPKPKAQEKTTGIAARSATAAPPAVPPALAGSSVTAAATNSSTLVPSPPARADSPVDAGARQAAAMPETNPFQRLDGGEAQPALLHSSAHQIAVGVHDSSLGWLEVQTQSSAGHISATLTAASVEAHASLAAQAPAITQYLADRNVPVHSVNVHTQADTQSGASGGGQSHSGAGNARQEASGRGGVTAEEGRPPSVSETGSASMRPAGSGSYISVRA